MRQLKWSRNSAGSLNGKVGHVTLFVIAFYAERGYFLAPKLPGFNKTIPVNSEEDGKRKAELLYQRYFDFLRGAEWYQEPDYAEPTSLRPDSREKPLHRSKPSPPSGLRESNMFSPVERRRHNRLFISLPIHYQTRNPGSGEIHQGDGVIRDISLSGSYFYLDHDAPFQPGQILSLTIDTTKPSLDIDCISYLKAEGEVIRLEPRGPANPRFGVAVHLLQNLSPQNLSFASA